MLLKMLSYMDKEASHLSVRHQHLLRKHKDGSKKANNCT